MGDWYDIKMKFENRSDSMSELLVNNGVAEIVVENDRDKISDYIKIDIKKLDAELYDEINKVRKEKNEEGLKEYFSINYKEDYTESKGGLQYYSKWNMDETILSAISRYFKDDVIYVQASYSRYPEYYSYFVKNGEVCLRDGTKIDAAILNLSSNLIKELSNGNIRVSLPIGEENDKWGTFELTKNNVELVRFKNYGDELVLCKPTLLLQGDINVSFKSKSKIYTSKELANAYLNSKENFRNKMNEDVRLVGLSNDYFRKITNSDMGNDYYIVSLPCKRNISANGKITIAFPEYEVNLDSERGNSIYLGTFGSRGKNVRYQKEDGSFAEKLVRPMDIKQIYEEALSTSRLNSTPINQSNDIEEDEELER